MNDKYKKESGTENEKRRLLDGYSSDNEDEVQASSVELSSLQSASHHLSESKDEQIASTRGISNQGLNLSSSSVTTSPSSDLQPPPVQPIVPGTPVQVPAANPLPEDNATIVIALTQRRIDPLELITEEKELGVIFPNHRRSDPESESKGRYYARSGRWVGGYIRNPNFNGDSAVMEIDKGFITIREGSLAGSSPIYIEVRVKLNNLDYTITNLKNILEEIKGWRHSRQDETCGSIVCSFFGGTLSFFMMVFSVQYSPINKKMLAISGLLFAVSLIIAWRSFKEEISLNPHGWDLAIEDTLILDKKHLNLLKQYFIQGCGQLQRDGLLDMSKASAAVLRPILERFLFGLEAIRDSKDRKILMARGITQSVGCDLVVRATDTAVQVKVLTEQSTETKGRESKGEKLLLSTAFDEITLELSSEEEFLLVISEFENIVNILQAIEDKNSCDGQVNFGFSFLSMLFIASFMVPQIVSLRKDGRLDPFCLFMQVVLFLYAVVSSCRNFDLCIAQSNAMNTPFLGADFLHLSADSKSILGNCIKKRGDMNVTVVELSLIIRKFLPVLHDIQNGFYPECSRVLGLPLPEDPAPTVGSNTTERKGEQKAPGLGSFLYARDEQSSQSQTSNPPASSQTTVGQGVNQPDVEEGAEQGQDVDASNNPTA